MSDNQEILSKPLVRLYDIKLEPVDFSNITEKTAETKYNDGSTDKYTILTDMTDGSRVYRQRENFVKMVRLGDEPRYTQIPGSIEPKAGIGRVMEMFDNKTGTRIAAKYVQHKTIDSVAEARIMARFNHPNVAKVFDIAITGKGKLCMITEWIEGETLADWMVFNRSFEEVGNVLKQALAGIAYINSKNVIHGDLKPQNVMIDKYGVVKIIDFGVASPGNEDAIKKEGLMFTLWYCPPEQIDGYLSTRTDVYSTGTMIFNIFSGMLGQTAKDHRDIFQERIDRQFPLSSDYRNYFDSHPEKLQKLSDILHKALAISPHDRYPSVKDMEADLGEVFGWK